MVPFGIKTMCRTISLATLTALMAVCGCEAAKPSSQTGSLLKLPGLGGGEYATIFTIRCMEGNGPDGMRFVDQMAAGLRNVKGLDAKLVTIDKDATSSRLYYGTYKGQANKSAGQFSPPSKAREDLEVVRGMECPTQVGSIRPFQLASIVDMPTPDPGPAEWNLKNAPGVFTLQICYCIDKPTLPNRKDVAVAICKELRDQGEEAWYLHNNRASVVTVGHFDESALVQDPKGQLSYSPAVLALQKKREEFKYNTENLQKVVRVIGQQRITSPSMLIYIKEPANDLTARPQTIPSPTANPFSNR